MNTDDRKKKDFTKRSPDPLRGARLITLLCHMCKESISKNKTQESLPWSLQPKTILGTLEQT